MVHDWLFGDVSKFLTQARYPRWSDEDASWTVDGVAFYLRKSTEWVRARARAGLLPARKIGRAWSFNPREIRAIAHGQGRPHPLRRKPPAKGLKGGQRRLQATGRSAR